MVAKSGKSENGQIAVNSVISKLILISLTGKLVRKCVERKQIHLRARRRLNVETLLVWRRQSNHDAMMLTKIRVIRG